MMKWFDRQRQALDYFEQVDKDQHGIFVLHKFCGRRRFCVVSLEEFAQTYTAYDLQLCHYFEVIRENTPVRLFLDIDIKNAEYLEIGEDLVEILIKYVNHCLLQQYGITCNRKQIIQLDSSSSTKFSQHLIYPEVTFRTNEECGHFVKNMENSAKDAVVQKKESKLTFGFPTLELEKMFVTLGKYDVFLVDTTVYTKNRHFRIYRSSKLGKEQHLLVSKSNEFPIISEQEFLLQSLVVGVGSSSNEKFLTCEATERKEVKATKSKEVVDKDPPRMVTRHKQLDEFVINFIHNTKGNQHAVIEDIKPAESGLCFAYIGSFWCMNVQRKHSKNRSYFIANMKLGTVYQKCFSGKCENFRSPSAPIPIDIVEKFHIGDVDAFLEVLEASDDILEEVLDL